MGFVAVDIELAVGAEHIEPVVTVEVALEPVVDRRGLSRHP